LNLPDSCKHSPVGEESLKTIRLADQLLASILYCSRYFQGTAKHQAKILYKGKDTIEMQKKNMITKRRSLLRLRARLNSELWSAPMALIRDSPSNHERKGIGAD
jgi:hypothetical protein